MKNLYIRNIALYGFGAVFMVFIATGILTVFYVNQIEKLEKEVDFYEKSHESLFEFKYYTERLLTTHNLKNETRLWLNSRNTFEKYFKAIEDTDDINYENFVNFWYVIDDESKKIEVKLKNKLFDKKSTQERSILRRLGEWLDENKSSDYYLALTDLKSSIDYIKQYESFLLDELDTIRSEKVNDIILQIQTVKKTGAVIISILTIISFAILYYVINLISKVEHRLKYSLDELKVSNDEKEKLNIAILDNYQKTLLALVDMIEERDTYTGGHSQRVAKYSMLIAKELGYKKEDVDKIYQAGILHDIGKINIPDSVLLKPGKLDDIEYKIIQDHAENGYKLLKQIPMYVDLANIIHYHHERYDGKGYPTGKKLNETPIFSYILSVADAFDAMTTNRIYRSRKKVNEAIEEIKKCSGTQFHPEISNAAVKALKDVQVDLNISQIPNNLIEMERFSYFYKDKVSGIYNEQYLDFILSKSCHEQSALYIDIFYMNNFAQYNKNNGWSKGNQILYSFAEFLKESFTDSLIFRIHGDDFVVLNNKKSNIENVSSTKLEILKDTSITINHRALGLIDKKICSFTMLEKIL